MFDRFDHLMPEFVICFAQGALMIREAVEDIECFQMSLDYLERRNDAQPWAHGGKRVLVVIHAIKQVISGYE